MGNREDDKLVMKEFIDIAREHQYSDDMIFNIGMVCGSEQMYDKGYTLIQAFRKAIDFVLNGKNAIQTMEEILKMSGYDVSNH